MIFLLWACGPDHDHAAHDHETEAGHSHEAELAGHEAALHAGHDHGEENAGHSDEIVISPEKAEAIGIVTETVSPGKFREIIRTSGEILPAAGDDAPFMKKDTVIGTIGKTQGVSRAANPHRIASMTIPQLKPLVGEALSIEPCNVAGDALMSTLNFQYSGILQ